MPLQKLLQYEEEGDVVAAEVAVVVVAELQEEHPTVSPPVSLPPDIEVPSTLTYPRESGRGVACTSGGAVKQIFVQNLPLVPGEMCSNQSLRNNEGLTSSATQ